MKNTNEFYAVQVTVETGEKLLCWKEKKHLYFAGKTRGFASPPPPTLFLTRKEAKSAIDNVPSKGGNLKQFAKALEPKKTQIVKVKISAN